MDSTSRSTSGDVIVLNGENAMVHFSDGHEQVPRALLERSTMLRQALTGKEDIERLVVPSPRGLLGSWLQWRTNESWWDVEYGRDVEQMVIFLEAADYLGDEEGCRKLCQQVAWTIIPQPPNRTDTRQRRDTKVLLEDLPSNLQEAIFAACTTPCTRLLSVIHPELHMAAFNASYPRLNDNAAIQVSARDALDSGGVAKQFWALVQTRTCLQSLSIDLSDHARYAQLACPGPILGLSGLTHLKIHGGNIPFGDGDDKNGWDISHLKFLKHLSLSEYAVRDGAMRGLAPQLCHLTALEHLDLSACSIETGGAEHLAPCLAKMSCLRHLDLARNSLNRDALRVLVPEIATLSRLTFLNLRYNLFDGEEIVAELLPSLKMLKDFNLAGCYLGKHLFTKFSVLTGLLSLNIESSVQSKSHNLLELNRELLEVKDLLVTELPRQLACMTALTCLNIANNRLVDEDFKALAPSLGQLSHLRSLAIRASTPHFGEGLITLMSHMSHITAMQTLRMRWFEMSDVAAMAVVRYLQTLPDLQHLRIGQWESIATVAACMSSLTSLTHLELETYGDCTCDSEKAWKDFSQSLSGMKGLKCFYLSGVDGPLMTLIAAGIGHLTALEHLHVSGGYAEGVGVLALCRLLSSLKHLRSLVWCFRERFELDKEGVECLTQTLRQMTSLQRLYLPSRRMDKEQADRLVQFVSQSCSLQCVSFLGAGVNRQLSENGDPRILS